MTQDMKISSCSLVNVDAGKRNLQVKEAPDVPALTKRRMIRFRDRAFDAISKKRSHEPARFVSVRNGISMTRPSFATFESAKISTASSFRGDESSE